MTGMAASLSSPPAAPSRPAPGPTAYCARPAAGLNWTAGLDVDVVDLLSVDSSWAHTGGLGADRPRSPMPPDSADGVVITGTDTDGGDRCGWTSVMPPVPGRTDRATHSADAPDADGPAICATRARWRPVRRLGVWASWWISPGGARPWACRNWRSAGVQRLRRVGDRRNVRCWPPGPAVPGPITSATPGGHRGRLPGADGTAIDAFAAAGARGWSSRRWEPEMSATPFSTGWWRKPADRVSPSRDDPRSQ